MIERAELGVDGNAAFAILGPNIMEGEVEFVEIIDDPQRTHYQDQRVAAYEALRRLRVRLNKPDLSYFIGPSHPGYR